MMRVTLLFVILSSAISGCVPIPVAVPEQKPFEEEVEGVLTTGSTTQAQLASILGAPALQRKDWRLYRDTREGWAWLFCVGGGYSAGCGAMPRTSSDYFLVVDFDANGILARDAGAG
jgi:hypothetical protein